MIKRIDTIVLLLFLAIFASYPQAQTENRIKVYGVAIQGVKTISENSVKVQSGIIEGKEIFFDDIPNAITRLWKLNLFSDIQIYLDKATEEGVFLIIKVEEYPRLGKFEIKGNKKIKKSKIEEELNMMSGKVLSPHLITDSIRKIKKLYEKEGYLLVDVKQKINDGENENTRNLTFEINEGKKVRIKDIVFDGNKWFSDRRLRRVLKDTKPRNLFLFRVGEFDEEKYTDDKEKLIEFYRNNGYRDIEIEYDTITYSENKKHIFFEIGIEEGERYKYRNITFNGNVLYSSDDLKTILNIKAGDWYDAEKLQKGIYERVNAVYMDQGYLFFQISPLEIPVSKNEIDLNCEITENHQVVVNQINIIGNSKTHENVIRRELKMFPGDIFSREALMRSQREIFILNYFANVTPDVLPIDDKKVDVEITVEEKSSGRANLSFSISQMYGLIGGGGVEFNNFRGRGQQVSVSYQRGAGYTLTGAATNPYKSFSISYSDPWIFDTPNLVGASFIYSERGQNGYYYYPFDLSQIGGSIRWSRRFRFPDNYFRGTWMLGVATKSYKNCDPDYLESVLLGHDKTKGVTLTQIISRDSRNAPEFPTQGSVFEWSSMLSGGFLGGTEHFHKHNFTLEYYLPTFWKFVLFNHVEFGVIKKLKSNSLIPPDERFIMGGSGMIYGVALRGYDDNQVGPTNVYSGTSLPYGGESLLKYTLEYRFPVSNNPTIYGLLFAEAGNTWKTLKSTDPFDVKRSAGIGVRFFMPMMGMLGVDFGYGFDDIDPEGQTGYGKPQGWKTHFIFGSQF
ncbi:MAG: outer membrane protein assembly factor BamA [Candidatus Marinimicrobia bacterium CG08_land_8_20_14_0_20_45_22]|nr:MAG: outer membrane protein assembly factor BamA [Candidatus Marinimicrobia bacterium CG08_land_8_20_14_0_20_45_22]